MKCSSFFVFISTVGQSYSVIPEVLPALHVALDVAV